MVREREAVYRLGKMDAAARIEVLLIPSTDIADNYLGLKLAESLSY